MATLETFDFSSILCQVDEVKQLREKEIQDDIQRRVSQVAQTSHAPLASLPNQDPGFVPVFRSQASDFFMFVFSGSLEMHSAIVEAYAKSRQLLPKPPAQVPRKVTARKDKRV